MQVKTTMRLAFEALANPYGIIKERLRGHAGIRDVKDCNYRLSFRTFHALKGAGYTLA